MVEHQTSNSLLRGPSRPLDTHGYPGGGGVVFSNESGKLDVIPVSVHAYVGGWYKIEYHALNVAICLYTIKMIEMKSKGTYSNTIWV